MNINHRDSIPAIIIVCAMMLAGYWMFLVPIFQSPDEDYHADYVFSLYAKGRLIRGVEAPIAAYSHPLIFYLLRVTNGQAVKHHQFMKMSIDYGTKLFFKRLNKDAPDSHAPVHTNPVMMAVYPCGYYVLTALWLSVVSHLNNSLTFLFFAARLFSILLLGCGLIFSHLTMKELGLPRLQSSLILAAIGFFPLVSFVGSYIQPDNLSFAAVNACFYFALRWRNTISKRCARLDFSIANNWMIWLLGMALAILLLSKYHFFCYVGIAIVAMVIARAIRSKISLGNLAKIFAILCIPSVIAAVVQLWISCGCSLPAIDRTCFHWFAVTPEFQRVFHIGGQALIMHIRNALCDQCQSIYSVDGPTFKSFWGDFGWLDTPLVIASIKINDALQMIIELVTRIILFLTLASIGKIIVSLWRIMRRGRFACACYIACSNPVINSYFLFVLFMFLFNVIVYPSFQGQGRHWFPLILPILLAAASFAPRIFPSRAIRRQMFLLIVGGWLFYSLIGNYFALGCIEKRYYARDNKAVIDVRQLQPTSIGASYFISNLDYTDPYPTFERHPRHAAYSIAVPSGKDVCIDIEGWAIDFPASSLASAVLLFVDHDKIYQAMYGLENYEAVQELHDPKYRFSGFGALIPTKGLSPGEHSLSIKVVSKDGLALYNTDRDIQIAIK